MPGRLSASDVANLPLFARVKVVRAVAFLATLPIQSNASKLSFFRELPGYIEDASQSVLDRHVLGSILAAPMFLEPEAEALLRPILTPRTPVSGTFPMTIFESRVVPFLLSSFALRHVQQRIVLLHLFDCYAEAFSRAQLQQSIIPELILGLDDANNDIMIA